MAEVGENTGNALVITLKRVRTDVPFGSEFYHEPMDANGVPTRLSELPQHIINNDVGHPNYIAPYPDEDCAVTVYGFVNIYNNGRMLPLTDYTVKLNDVLIDDLTDDHYIYFNASHGSTVNIKIKPITKVGDIDHDIYSAPDDAVEILNSELSHWDTRTFPDDEFEYVLDTNVHHYLEMIGYQAISSFTLINEKDEDPHVDTLIVPLVNGVNAGNMYATGTQPLTNIYEKDVVTIYMNRSPSSVHWPVGSTAQLTITEDGIELYDSEPVYSATDELANSSINLIANRAYVVKAKSTGDSTNYLPVILTQINNSSAPLSTSKPTVVNFRIQDNTNGEMVFDDGTYQQPNQINGFNYLDTGGALADQATLIITNRHNVSLRFLIQSWDLATTWWNIDVPAGDTITLPTLPKQSVTITYTDTP